MQTVACPSCGAALDVVPGNLLTTCGYCQCSVQLSKDLVGDGIPVATIVQTKTTEPKKSSRAGLMAHLNNVNQEINEITAHNYRRTSRINRCGGLFMLGLISGFGGAAISAANNSEWIAYLICIPATLIAIVGLIGLCIEALTPDRKERLEELEEQRRRIEEALAPAAQGKKKGSGGLLDSLGKAIMDILE